MPSEVGRTGQPVQRLHPLSLLFTVGQQARNLLLPGIVVLVFASGRGWGGELWFMVLCFPDVIAALFHYWSYRYRFDAEELVIREGIVFRNERHIPYARIQNVDLVQNPLHRMFDVAEVRLETAGGDKPEAVMRVLSLEAVDHLRTRVFAGRRERAPLPTTDEDDAVAPVAGGADPSRLLHSLNAGDVVRFGLISNKGMVVVAAAVGALWQLDLFDRWWESLSRDSVERLRSMLPSGGLLSGILLAVLAIVVLLILMRALSVLWAIGKFHGFRLTLRGEDLRAEHGLLTRVSKTIPRHRIQVLSTRESFLHRRCGRVAVEVETAGSTGQQSGSSSGRLWLAPLIRRERVAALLREALPDVDLSAIGWMPVSPRTRRRLLRRAFYLVAIASVPAFWGLGPAGLTLPLALVPLAWINASLYVRHTAYALVPGAVVYRSGWWNRRLSVARFSKIQSLEQSASPFDRRYGMAALRVDTAGATRTGHSVDIPYLDTAVVNGLVDRLFAEAGRTAFRW